MILNYYENTAIANKNLPDSWQHQNDLDELADFLQQNWEQRAVFYEDSKITSKQQFISFTGRKGIRTQNYVGTIVYKGDQLNIFPKMFRNDPEDNDVEDLSMDHLMNNLVNWLQYCNKMEYPFINIASDLKDTKDLRELFITLYVRYVKSALDRGGYYQYIEQENDCKSIKGKFNFTDFITKKVPNKQYNNFLCSYSHFEFDNKVNQIIKYTCSMLLNICSNKNQKILKRIIMKLDQVTSKVCIPSDCDNIRLSKMHKNYHIILCMSKMFLLNKMSDYTHDSHISFCFLFPMELLFEGFIGGFIQEAIESCGGHVKLQQSDLSLIDEIRYGDMNLGTGFTMRHDIVVEKDDKIFILDTKYKAISRFEGDRENIRKTVTQEPSQTDVYQVCEYARKRGLNDVYLLYPMYRYEDLEPDFPIGISKDTTGCINVHFIRLPFIFEDDVSITKKCLKKVIDDIFTM